MKFKDLSTRQNFLKLKSGEEIRGIFRADPVDFRQHWSNGRGVICTGRDKCELCKAGEKSNFRFRINFVVNENGAYVAKVFEQGKAVYEALKALHQDYNLETNQMKIRRVGTGTETNYTILPVPNGKFTPEAMKALETVKLNTLLDEPTAEPSTESEDEDGEDVPF